MPRALSGLSTRGVGRSFPFFLLVPPLSYPTHHYFDGPPDTCARKSPKILSASFFECLLLYELRFFFCIRTPSLANGTVLHTRQFRGDFFNPKGQCLGGGGGGVESSSNDEPHQKKNGTVRAPRLLFFLVYHTLGQLACSLA